MIVRTSALLLGAALLSACGPTSLNMQGARGGASLNLPSGEAGSLVQMTDLDTVHDVSEAGSRILVATDRGVLIYSPGSDTPRRLTRADGLPGDSVAAIAVGVDGRALLATEAGMAGIVGESLDGAVPSAPPVGQVVDLHLTDDGVLWACGTAGLARLGGQGWQRFGEEVTCTGIHSTLSGAFWVASNRGALYVDGDVISDHAPGRGIPEAYVRDILPMDQGQAFAIVQGPNVSRLAFFDGARWYAYSVRGLEGKLVGLARTGRNAVLFTPGRAFLISPAATGEGVPLVATAVGPAFGVRSYRARITAAEDIVAGESVDIETLRLAPVSLAPLPMQVPTLPAPRWLIRSLEGAPSSLYLVRRSRNKVFLADRNRGVIALGDDGSQNLRSSDLVAEENLQVAVDEEGQSWILSRDRELARWDGEGFVREAAPAGVSVQAIATGPNGAYVAGRVGASNQVRIFRRTSDGWAQVMERTLELEEEFQGVPFMAVGEGEEAWLALQVTHGEGSRVRGVGVLSPAQEGVLYHHRGASAEGELALQDEVTTIDLHQSGNAWFSSFYGAIRLGGHQAVVFNEARGVRGEIVTDIAVDGERVWMAAAEGLGYYEGQRMHFLLPQNVQEARPSSLALDLQGGLWAVGTRGAFHYDGTNWSSIGEAQGMPATSFLDVEVDRQQRVWFLTEGGVFLLDR